MAVQKKRKRKTKTNIDKEQVERAIDAGAEFVKSMLPFGMNLTDKLKEKVSKKQKMKKLKIPKKIPQNQTPPSVV